MLKKARELFAAEFPFFIGVPALVWQVLFFYVPLTFVLAISIWKVGAPIGFSLFTLDHYRALLDVVYLKVIVRSLLFAVGNATLCLLGGYPIAYFLARQVDRWQNFFLFLLILPFWTNFLLHVYSWFFVLERDGFLNVVLKTLGVISEPLNLLNSTFAVVLVMVYCYLPFMVLPIYSILEKMDSTLLEASSDLGATPGQTFFNITLPLSMPGIRTGFFLVLVPSFGEFAIPALVGGDRYMYVGSLISHYYLVARNASLGSSFTIVASVFLVAAALMIHRFFARNITIW